jgi:uncharacterized membrane protein YbhN (UPF0104 family)
VTERRWWWRALQTALAVVVIGLALRKLAANWTELQTQSIHWDVRVGWLLSAVGIVWAAYALLVEAWRRVVVSMEQRLGYWDAARICMVSNLGKYIPGKVWAIAGNAMLAQQAGVAAPAAVAGALVLQALALASGIALVAALGPAALRGAGTWYVAAAVALGVLALAGVAFLTCGRALGALRRWWPSRVPMIPPIPLPTMLVAFAANVVAWGAYGLAFLCLVRGLTPDTALSWSRATTVFAISYLVGLIAVFAPAGVGPRESLFYLLLAGPVGPKLAVALALATRVLLTVTELGSAVPFLVVRKGASR